MSTTGKTAHVFSAAAALFNARKKPLVAPHFIETYTDHDGRNGWQVKDNDGKVIAASAGGFSSDADLRDSIKNTIDALIEWYNAVGL